MTDVLRVEKRSRTVRVLLEDGGVVRVTMFVAWGMEGSPEQTIARALDDAGPVVPCQDAAGNFLLLGSRSICAAGVARDELEEFVVRHRARVSLRGGHVLSGYLLRDMGMGDRFSDAMHGQIVVVTAVR